MISSPRWQWLRIEARFAMVPLGTNRAASLPIMRATLSCRRLSVGSSPHPSSPTSAVAIACRIAGVGCVTVSLRRVDLPHLSTS